MGPNSKLYLSLIDEVFHRNNPEAISHHVTGSYRAHDPFIDEITVRGRRGLSELILRELREVRYDTCDVFEQGDRVAARFVVAGRRPNGTRVVVPGISINRVEDNRLREGWILADYSDVADLAKPSPLPADTWDGDPLPIDPAPPGHAKTRLQMYRWMIQQMYEARRPEALMEAVHADYVGFDPFRERGTGRQGAVEFHAKVISLYRDLRYHVLEAVEDGDRLAVRYRVEGTDTTGRRVVVPGISINHFEGSRIRRGWVLNHYGALS
jgi:predicted SnoaL-like aldol condensation-catalyzing enzyme